MIFEHNGKRTLLSPEDVSLSSLLSKYQDCDIISYDNMSEETGDLVVKFLTIPCVSGRSIDMFTRLAVKIEADTSIANVLQSHNPNYSDYAIFIDSLSSAQVIDLIEVAVFMGIHPLCTLLGMRIRLEACTDPSTFKTRFYLDSSDNSSAESFLTSMNDSDGDEQE